MSGNRNFEGRVHNEVRLNYLASPPLVVAYALAGTMDFDPLTDPIAETPDGTPVTLADLWPSEHEVVDTVRASRHLGRCTRERYGAVFAGDERWAAIEASTGETFNVGPGFDLRVEAARTSIPWDPIRSLSKRSTARGCS